MFKRKIAKAIEKFDDGTMEVTITFDPFYHGHDLGSARNYDPEEYRKMVENPSTQARIANGYAIGYYSHHSRNPNRGYIAGERDAEGREVMPCCKTLMMKWDNGKVTHTQRILANRVGKEIQKLIEGGVGGFSSVHNLKTGEFMGFDYVIAPNFSSNRAIVDNACENGVCAINTDDVKAIIRDNVENYLNFIGVDSIEVRDALVELETDTTLLDAVKAEIHLKDIEIEELKEQIRELKKEHKIFLDDLETNFGINSNLELTKDWSRIKYANIDDIRAKQLEKILEIKKEVKIPKDKMSW